MRKRLEEMSVSELLTLLTRTQQQSVLAFARKFAQANQAASRDSGSQNVPLARNKQNVASSSEPKLVSRSRPISSSSVIDKVRNIGNESAHFNASEQVPEWINCVRCGLLIHRNNFQRHLNRAHLGNSAQPAESITRLIDQAERQLRKPRRTAVYKHEKLPQAGSIRRLIDPAKRQLKEPRRTAVYVHKELPEPHKNIQTCRKCKQEFVPGHNHVGFVNVCPECFGIVDPIPLRGAGLVLAGESVPPEPLSLVPTVSIGSGSLLQKKTRKKKRRGQS